MERGLERREGETLAAWHARIRGEDTVGAADLTRLLMLHYRLRFDPAGLNTGERDALKSEVMEWVGRNGSLPAKP